MNGWVILGILSGVLFIRMVIIPALRGKTIQQKQQIVFNNKMQIVLRIARAENFLIQSNKIPTEEHIDLYYKMHCKKFEIDHGDDWTTYENQPMDIEKFKKNALTLDNGGGYRYIIAMTMDMFVGFPPNTQMSRFNNYYEMVLSWEEMEAFLTDIEKEMKPNDGI